MSAEFLCSDAAREAALDPVGTAGSYTDFLLVETPLPWPRDVPKRKVGGRKVRVQLVVQPDGHVGDQRRVVLWRRDRGEPFAGFRGTETAVAPDEVDEACDRLLAGEGAPVAARDVLVCTHGNRDRCCGRLGTLALAAALVGEVPPDVRLWRTTHTGGHRFAPTGITFPDGVFWAYLDDLGALLHRRGDLVRNHRGCAGLDTPEAQAVDREAFARFGWGWLSTPRWVEGDVLHGADRTVTATVEVARQVPVLDCGEPPTGKEKRQPELRVVRFDVTVR